MSHQKIERSQHFQKIVRYTLMKTLPSEKLTTVETAHHRVCNVCHFIHSWDLIYNAWQELYCRYIVYCKYECMITVITVHSYYMCSIFRDMLQIYFTLQVVMKCLKLAAIRCYLYCFRNDSRSIASDFNPQAVDSSYIRLQPQLM